MSKPLRQGRQANPDLVARDCWHLPPYRLRENALRNADGGTAGILREKPTAKEPHPPPEEHGRHSLVKDHGLPTK